MSEHFEDPARSSFGRGTRKSNYGLYLENFGLVRMRKTPARSRMGRVDVGRSNRGHFVAIGQLFAMSKVSSLFHTDIGSTQRTSHQRFGSSS